METREVIEQLKALDTMTTREAVVVIEKLIADNVYLARRVMEIAAERDNVQVDLSKLREAAASVISRLREKEPHELDYSHLESLVAEKAE